MLPEPWLRRSLGFMLGGLLLAGSLPLQADEGGICSWRFAGAEAALVFEAVQEAVEMQGLVPTPPLHFGDMLERTGPALGQGASPYRSAQTLQFCSARLAWQLVQEDPLQVALCPMAITVYALQKGEGAYLVYRRPGDGSPVRRQLDALLRTVAEQAARLAGGEALECSGSL